MMGEKRLLMEYLAENYPGCVWFVQFRVGSDPEMGGAEYEDEAERRLARNVNYWVDGVVVTPTELVVIEATMYRGAAKAGKLLEYMKLLPATPELRPYLGRRVVGEVVSAQDDPLGREVCKDLGIRFVVYAPSWLPEFWALYPDRRRRPANERLVQALRQAEEAGSSKGEAGV
jgi:hypothetical protein